MRIADNCETSLEQQQKSPNENFVPPKYRKTEANELRHLVGFRLIIVVAVLRISGSAAILMNAKLLSNV